MADTAHEADTPADAAAGKPPGRLGRIRGLIDRVVTPTRQRLLQSMLWAVIVWSALQFSVVRDSFVGAPDVDGLNQIIKLRENAVGGVAAPLAFLDFDDANWDKVAERRPPLPPSAERARGGSDSLTVPRHGLAQMIDFLATSQAAAVLVDVDTSVVTAPDEDRAYAEAVDRWRKRPGAPLLILARTDWSGEGLLERNGLPPIATGDRVVEGSVLPVADQSFVTKSITYVSCETSSRRSRAVASAAVYAAVAARHGDPMAAKAAVSEALSRIRCDVPLGRQAMHVPTPHGWMRFHEPVGPINFHLSLKPLTAPPEAAVDWPQATLRPHFASLCERETAPVMTVLPVHDFLVGLDQGPVSASAVCGSIVLVGSSSKRARDELLTPYDTMPGAVLLGNAARGMDLAGPIQRFPYWIGLIYIIIMSIFVGWIFEVVGRFAHWSMGLNLKGVLGKGAKWLAEMASHPLSVSAWATQLLAFLGLGLTFVMIDHGFWGVFAAPVLAATLSNAFDQFSDMRRALFRRDETGET